MNEIDGMMLDIAEYLQKQMKAQINLPRPSRAYNGQTKPISGRYPTPISNRRASSTLYNQLKVYWTEQFDEESATPTLVVDFGAAEDYAYFVDQGRRPGKYPPLAAIDKWVRQKKGIKGIRNEKGQFISRKSQVFLIRRSIGKYGYRGINFIDKAIESSIEKIGEDLGAVAQEFLIKYLEDKGTIYPI
jgi:hypothetical protein